MMVADAKMKSKVNEETILKRHEKIILPSKENIWLMNIEMRGRGKNALLWGRRILTCDLFLKSPKALTSARNICLL